jgi:hypothetical protein
LASHGVVPGNPLKVDHKENGARETSCH